MFAKKVAWKKFNFRDLSALKEEFSSDKVLFYRDKYLILS